MEFFEGAKETELVEGIQLLLNTYFSERNCSMLVRIEKDRNGKFDRVLNLYVPSLECDFTAPDLTTLRMEIKRFFCPSRRLELVHSSAP